MLTIEEKISAGEAKKQEIYSPKQQQELVSKYLAVVNKRLDECNDYVNHAKYGMDYGYSIKSIKSQIEHSNPETLYSLFFLLKNLESYNIPYECGNILGDFADSIGGKHHLELYDPKAISTQDLIYSIGLDTSTEISEL